MKVPKQGGVKNYLGKQEMVKAPKKWKSAPNHPDTELAYITKAEKDALIKMNLHGSMNGKAHKGPSGIISLNGWGDADRGYDSPSSGGHDHGGSDGNDYQHEMSYSPPSPPSGPPGGGDSEMTYTAPAPVVETPPPTPEPVVEKVAPVPEPPKPAWGGGSSKAASDLDKKSKVELEKIGRTMGIELDRRLSHSKLVDQLQEEIDKATY